MKGYRVATQKNRNLTVYTMDARKAAMALTALASALRIEGQRGPSPSEMVSWIVLNLDEVTEVLRPVREKELARITSEVKARQ